MMKKAVLKRKREQPQIKAVPQKDGFEDFMKKEIFTQTAVVKRFLDNYIEAGKISFNFYKINVEKIKRAYIVCDMVNYGCAVLGAYNFEVIADLMCIPVLMSEFNCANPILDKYTLVIVLGECDKISRSATVNRILKCGARLIYIGNKSSSDKLKNCIEINERQMGLAPTAGNTVNNLALSLICLYFGKKAQVITDLYFDIATKMVFELNEKIKEVLEKDYILNALSKEIITFDKIIFTGKNIDFSCALYGEALAEGLCGMTAKAIPTGELNFSDAKRSKLIAFISNRELMSVALRELQPYRENTILVIPESIKNEINGFNRFITYKGSIPLYNPIMGNIIIQLLLYNAAKNKSLPTDRS
ncbi:MAG: hypothetical protein ACI4IQ_04480 [Eubacterium sp.]